MHHPNYFSCVYKVHYQCLNFIDFVTNVRGLGCIKFNKTLALIKIIAPNCLN